MLICGLIVMGCNVCLLIMNWYNSLVWVLFGVKYEL
jgi:hypothetical protein